MLLTIDLLLADACPSTQRVNDDGELVLTTTIELHCFKYEIEYIKLIEGEYDNNMMVWVSAPLFHVLNWTKQVA